MTEERRKELQDRIFVLHVEKRMNFSRYEELAKLADEQIARIRQELEDGK